MAEHFLFAPQGIGAGVCYTPLTGEVEVGKIYRIEREEVAAALRGHSDWQGSNQQAYDAQQKEQS